MDKKTNKFLLWAPRILGIIFILFLAMFSLDVFDLGLGFWPTLAGLLIHNIPALILLIVILISWRYPLVGGIVFILAGIAYIFMTADSAVAWYIALSWSLTIAVPAILTGVLFLLSWRQARK